MNGKWQKSSVLMLAVLAGAFLLQKTVLATAQPQEAPATPSTATLEGPEQPIPYSHAQHAGTLKLPCQFCHTATRSGENVVIPQAQFCMQCHQSIATDKPSIQKLANYAASNTPIPWVRVYQVPSFVTFSHKTHLASDITCQQCHGPVQTRARIYKEADFSMAGCVKCHQQTKAATGCDTCHSLEK